MLLQTVLCSDSSFFYSLLEIDHLPVAAEVAAVRMQPEVAAVVVVVRMQPVATVV